MGIISTSASPTTSHTDMCGFDNSSDKILDDGRAGSMLERVSVSLVVLDIARGMRCWGGRLKNLWLFNQPRLTLLAVRH